MSTHAGGSVPSAGGNSPGCSTSVSASAALLPTEGADAPAAAISERPGGCGVAVGSDAAAAVSLSIAGSPRCAQEKGTAVLSDEDDGAPAFDFTQAVESPELLPFTQVVPEEALMALRIVPVLGGTAAVVTERAVSFGAARPAAYPLNRRADAEAAAPGGDYNKYISSKHGSLRRGDSSDSAIVTCTAQLPGQYIVIDGSAPLHRGEYAVAANGATIVLGAGLSGAAPAASDHRVAFTLVLAPASDGLEVDAGAADAGAANCGGAVAETRQPPQLQIVFRPTAARGLEALAQIPSARSADVAARLRVSGFEADAWESSGRATMEADAVARAPFAGRPSRAFLECAKQLNRMVLPQEFPFLCEYQADDLPMPFSSMTVCTEDCPSLCMHHPKHAWAKKSSPAAGAKRARGTGWEGAAAAAPTSKRHRSRPTVPAGAWGCACGVSNLPAEVRCRRCKRRRGEGGEAEPVLCFDFLGRGCARRSCKYLH